MGDDKGPQPYAELVSPVRIAPPSLGKCPIWALFRAMEGKTGSSRCNPGCQIFLEEAGDCSIKVLARMSYAKM